MSLRHFCLFTFLAEFGSSLWIMGCVTSKNSKTKKQKEIVGTEYSNSNQSGGGLFDHIDQSYHYKDYNTQDMIYGVIGGVAVAGALEAGVLADGECYAGDTNVGLECGGAGCAGCGCD